MRRFLWAVVAFALVAGVVLRLLDLTDPPLDFYPTRQYQGLILARSFYLQWRPGPITQEEIEKRAAGIYVPRYEPPLLPMLMARIYLAVGREVPWAVRIVNAFLWLVAAGGLALWLREAGLRTRAGLAAALSYWMLLPFAVQTSRAFLPDPAMVTLLVWSLGLWMYARRTGRLVGYLLAGLLGAAAAVVKIYALFFLAFGPAALLLFGEKEDPRPPRLAWLAWMLPALVAVPVYLRLHTPGQASSFLLSWTLRVARWWRSPMPYGGWMDLVNNNLHGGWVVLAALAWLWKPRTRRGYALALGWLAGYLAFGLVFLLQYATHAYYHLPLVPWVALGLALAAEDLYQQALTWSRFRQALLALLTALVLVYPVGITYWNLISVDYRPRIALYRRLGQELPEGKIVAVTEAYGLPLLYYGGVRVIQWPSQGYAVLFGAWDPGFENVFRARTQGADYFLVTDFEEFWRQEPLRRYLYDTFPLVHQGGDYLLWDLRRPRR